MRRRHFREPELQMKARVRTTLILLSAAVIVSLANFSSLLRVTQLRAGATLQEVLFIPSAKAVKRMSLGYTGLLADIYWTRAVQYFGEHHVQRSEDYGLLSPLLDITVALDPKLEPAYKFGAIFLAQKPPGGAGRPDLAVNLVERGIREFPDDWHLYFHLGFIEYIERQDYRAAARAFERGASVPKANPLLKVLAASMSQHAGDRETARLLWQNVYETSNNELIQDNALDHLAALQYDAQMQRLQDRVEAATRQLGHVPGSWREMIVAGLIAGVPLDPKGRPLLLMPDGRVQYSRPDDFPFVQLGLPKNRRGLGF
jgi:tetratricopeptide (TPR) repeat protein